MDQATAFFQNNSSILSTVAFLAVIIAILYVVYTYLYPADDPTYTQFLAGEADARKPVHLKKSDVPAIHTGGDFTLSMWIYIDDWNYKVSSSKFLFSIDPLMLGGDSISPLVGVLTPLQNGLMVRAATVATPGSSPTTGPPDITIRSNLTALMKQQSSANMFQTTLDLPCDIKEIPVQRWVNLTIVSSGRVLDIYMDGKLSRSCILENVLNVPRVPLGLRLGDYGGFGGRYSSVQMWGAQLTPDLIYGIYQMGPTQTQHNIFTDIAKYFNLNVSFTGSAPGKSTPSTDPNSNPFSQVYNQATGSASSSDPNQMYGDVGSSVQALANRF